MAIKSIQGNSDLARNIKNRRNELGLTIEEAAQRAGVGTKTWCRYEAGESIRQDKYRGVCKALNWTGISGEEEDIINIENYREHEAWSKYIENNFGEVAAASFAIGSDLLLDYVRDEMNDLLELPPNSHIGQKGFSIVAEMLPEQFRMRYDYEFMYALYTTVCMLRRRAHAGGRMVAHSVIEELAIYLMVQESQILLENSGENLEEGWEDWVFDLFDDMDIITCLYSDWYLTEDHCYHFKHWLEDQFFME